MYNADYIDLPNDIFYSDLMFNISAYDYVTDIGILYLVTFNIRDPIIVCTIYDSIILTIDKKFNNRFNNDVLKVLYGY
jgi:hypothetical protein